MSFKQVATNLNPVTHLKRYLDGVNASVQQTQVLAPQANQQQPPPAGSNQPTHPPDPSGQGGAGATGTLPVPVQNGTPTMVNSMQGTFIDASQLQGLIGNIVTNVQHQRRLVESFDEDKESFRESGVRRFYMGVFYLLPALVAYYVGAAIGDGFAHAALNWADAWNAFNHIISWAIEFSISGLVLAGSITARRIRSSSSEYLGSFVAICLALLFFSAASGAAQYVLVEAHLHPHGIEQAAALFRVSAGPAVDICSLLFLAVMRFKSLKKYLEDQERKRTAIHAASQAEIALQSEQVKAALDTQAALSDLETKAERAKVWNELERMQGQSMIENARRNMQDHGDGGFYRRSRY